MACRLPICDERNLKTKASEIRCFCCLEAATAASRTAASYRTTTENTTAAGSRSSDTDMTKETMSYTKNNMLVQAAQVMCVQANQLSQTTFSCWTILGDQGEFRHGKQNQLSCNSSFIALAEILQKLKADRLQNFFEKN